MHLTAIVPWCIWTLLLGATPLILAQNGWPPSVYSLTGVTPIGSDPIPSQTILGYLQSGYDTASGTKWIFFSEDSRNGTDCTDAALTSMLDACYAQTTTDGADATCQAWCCSDPAYDTRDLCDAPRSRILGMLPNPACPALVSGQSVLPLQCSSDLTITWVYYYDAALDGAYYCAQDTLVSRLHTCVEASVLWQFVQEQSLPGQSPFYAGVSPCLVNVTLSAIGFSGQTTGWVTGDTLASFCDLVLQHAESPATQCFSSLDCWLPYRHPGTPCNAARCDPFPIALSCGELPYTVWCEPLSPTGSPTSAYACSSPGPSFLTPAALDANGLQPPLEFWCALVPLESVQRASETDNAAVHAQGCLEIVQWCAQRAALPVDPTIQTPPTSTISQTTSFQLPPFSVDWATYSLATILSLLQWSVGTLTMTYRVPQEVFSCRAPNQYNPSKGRICGIDADTPWLETQCGVGVDITPTNVGEPIRCYFPNDDGWTPPPFSTSISLNQTAAQLARQVPSMVCLHNSDANIALPSSLVDTLYVDCPVPLASNPQLANLAVSLFVAGEQMASVGLVNPVTINTTLSPSITSLGNNTLGDWITAFLHGGGGTSNAAAFTNGSYAAAASGWGKRPFIIVNGSVFTGQTSVEDASFEDDPVHFGGARRLLSTNPSLSSSSSSSNSNSNSKIPFASTFSLSSSSSSSSSSSLSSTIYDTSLFPGSMGVAILKSKPANASTVLQAADPFHWRHAAPEHRVSRNLRRRERVLGVLTDHIQRRRLLQVTTPLPSTSFATTPSPSPTLSPSARAKSQATIAYLEANARFCSALLPACNASQLQCLAVTTGNAAIPTYVSDRNAFCLHPLPPSCQVPLGWYSLPQSPAFTCSAGEGRTPHVVQCYYNATSSGFCGYTCAALDNELYLAVNAVPAASLLEAVVATPTPENPEPACLLLYQFANHLETDAQSLGAPPGANGQDGFLCYNGFTTRYFGDEQAGFVQTPDSQVTYICTPGPTAIRTHAIAQCGAMTLLCNYTLYYGTPGYKCSAASPNFWNSRDMSLSTRGPFSADLGSDQAVTWDPDLVPEPPVAVRPNLDARTGLSLILEAEIDFVVLDFFQADQHPTWSNAFRCSLLRVLARVWQCQFATDVDPASGWHVLDTGVMGQTCLVWNDADTSTQRPWVTAPTSSYPPLGTSAIETDCESPLLTESDWVIRCSLTSPPISNFQSGYPMAAIDVGSGPAPDVLACYTQRTDALALTAASPPSPPVLAACTSVSSPMALRLSRRLALIQCWYEQLSQGGTWTNGLPVSALYNASTAPIWRQDETAAENADTTLICHGADVWGPDQFRDSYWSTTFLNFGDGRAWYATVFPRYIPEAIRMWGNGDPVTALAAVSQWRTRLQAQLCAYLSRECDSLLEDWVCNLPYEQQTMYSSSTSTSTTTTESYNAIPGTCVLSPPPAPIVLPPFRCGSSPPHVINCTNLDVQTDTTHQSASEWVRCHNVPIEAWQYPPDTADPRLQPYTAHSLGGPLLTLDCTVPRELLQAKLVTETYPSTTAFASYLANGVGLPNSSPSATVPDWNAFRSSTSVWSIAEQPIACYTLQMSCAIPQPAVCTGSPAQIQSYSVNVAALSPDASASVSAQARRLTGVLPASCQIPGNVTCNLPGQTCLGYLCQVEWRPGSAALSNSTVSTTSSSVLGVSEYVVAAGGLDMLPTYLAMAQWASASVIAQLSSQLTNLTTLIQSNAVTSVDAISSLITQLEAEGASSTSPLVAELLVLQGALSNFGVCSFTPVSANLTCGGLTIVCTRSVQVTRIGQYATYQCIGSLPANVSGTDGSYVGYGTHHYDSSAGPPMQCSISSQVFEQITSLEMALHAAGLAPNTSSLAQTCASLGATCAQQQQIACATSLQVLADGSVTPMLYASTPEQPFCTSLSTSSTGAGIPILFECSALAVLCWRSSLELVCMSMPGNTAWTLQTRIAPGVALDTGLWQVNGWPVCTVPDTVTDAWYEDPTQRCLTIYDRCQVTCTQPNSVTRLDTSSAAALQNGAAIPSFCEPTTLQERARQLVCDGQPIQCTPVNTSNPSVAPGTDDVHNVQLYNNYLENPDWGRAQQQLACVDSTVAFGAFAPNGGLDLACTVSEARLLAAGQTVEAACLNLVAQCGQSGGTLLCNGTYVQTAQHPFCTVQGATISSNTQCDCGTWWGDQSPDSSEYEIVSQWLPTQLLALAAPRQALAQYTPGFSTVGVLQPEFADAVRACATRGLVPDYRLWRATWIATGQATASTFNVLHDTWETLTATQQIEKQAALLEARGWRRWWCGRIAYEPNDALLMQSVSSDPALAPWLSSGVNEPSSPAIWASQIPLASSGINWVPVCSRLPGTRLPLCAVECPAGLQSQNASQIWGADASPVTYCCADPLHCTGTMTDGRNCRLGDHDPSVAATATHGPCFRGVLTEWSAYPYIPSSSAVSDLSSEIASWKHLCYRQRYTCYGLVLMQLPAGTLVPRQLEQTGAILPVLTSQPSAFTSVYDWLSSLNPQVGSSSVAQSACSSSGDTSGSVLGGWGVYFMTRPPAFSTAQLALWNPGRVHSSDTGLSYHLHRVPDATQAASAASMSLLPTQSVPRIWTTLLEDTYGYQVLETRYNWAWHLTTYQDARMDVNQRLLTYIRSQLSGEAAPIVEATVSAITKVLASPAILDSLRNAISTDSWLQQSLLQVAATQLGQPVGQLNDTVTANVQSQADTISRRLRTLTLTQLWNESLVVQDTTEASTWNLATFTPPASIFYGSGNTSTSEQVPQITWQLAQWNAANRVPAQKPHLDAVAVGRIPLFGTLDNAFSGGVSRIARTSAENKLSLTWAAATATCITLLSNQMTAAGITLVANAADSPSGTYVTLSDIQTLCVDDIATAGAADGVTTQQWVDADIAGNAFTLQDLELSNSGGLASAAATAVHASIGNSGTGDNALSYTAVDANVWLVGVVDVDRHTPVRLASIEQLVALFAWVRWLRVDSLTRGFSRRMANSYQTSLQTPLYADQEYTASATPVAFCSIPLCPLPPLTRTRSWSSDGRQVRIAGTSYDASSLPLSQLEDASAVPCSDHGQCVATPSTGPRQGTCSCLATHLVDAPMQPIVGEAIPFSLANSACGLDTRVVCWDPVREPAPCGNVATFPPFTGRCLATITDGQIASYCKCGDFANRCPGDTSAAGSTCEVAPRDCEACAQPWQQIPRSGTKCQVPDPQCSSYGYTLSRTPTSNPTQYVSRLSPSTTWQRTGWLQSYEPGDSFSCDYPRSMNAAQRPNGACAYTNANQTAARCTCNRGYYGDHCEFALLGATSSSATGCVAQTSAHCVWNAYTVQYEPVSDLSKCTQPVPSDMSRWDTTAASLAANPNPFIPIDATANRVNWFGSIVPASMLISSVLDNLGPNNVPNCAPCMGTPCSGHGICSVPTQSPDSILNGLTRSAPLSFLQSLTDGSMLAARDQAAVVSARASNLNQTCTCANGWTGAYCATPTCYPACVYGTCHVSAAGVASCVCTSYQGRWPLATGPTCAVLCGGLDPAPTIVSSANGPLCQCSGRFYTAVPAHDSTAPIAWCNQTCPLPSKLSLKTPGFMACTAPPTIPNATLPTIAPTATHIPTTPAGSSHPSATSSPPTPSPSTNPTSAGTSPNPSTSVTNSPTTPLVSVVSQTNTTSSIPIWMYIVIAILGAIVVAGVVYFLVSKYVLSTKTASAADNANAAERKRLVDPDDLSVEPVITSQYVDETMPL